MFPASSSSIRSKKTSRLKPPSNSSNSSTPPEDLAELSDVPCYTCRRRHVKCDGMLPSCAKCAKKGVSCLGYQKPLRWADAVAVRGKLKGKSEPVVDSKVVSIVRDAMQLQSSSAMQEAAHFGLQATESSLTDVTGNEATLSELMMYHNSRMCAERVIFQQTIFINRSIASLSLEVIQKLPRTMVNCILGNAAVHMASRQPGNRQLERLALETKVKVFQSFNHLLQNPQNQQADEIVACGILIFAMDLFEHGLSGWLIHFLGMIQVMSSFGGIENLFTYYPHLQLPFTHVAHFETLWIILSHTPVTKPKQAARRTVEMLCQASHMKRRFYNPCPAPLMLVVWDVGACASRVLETHNAITVADMHKREQILLEALAFDPKKNSRDIEKDYYQNGLTEARLRQWDFIGTAWKGAITIIVLRYLYFGRSNLAPGAQVRRSPTPSIASKDNTWLSSRNDLGAYHQGSEEFDFGNYVEETEDSESLPEHLSAGLYLHDPLSRSPSPLPYTDPPTSSLWENRYKIHDEAFSALSTSFSAIHDDLDPICLRYIILPLLILALASRQGSTERALCHSYFTKFKEFMAHSYPPETPGTSSYSSESSESSSPQGGEQLEFNVPWDKLDAYSKAKEEERQGNAVLDDGELTKGAPEWNWWDMLKHLEMNLAWPVTSGTSHLERGSEFWAFKLLSSVVNDEFLSNWTKESPTSQATSSST